MAVRPDEVAMSYERKLVVEHLLEFLAEGQVTPLRIEIALSVAFELGRDRRSVDAELGEEAKVMS